VTQPVGNHLEQLVADRMPERIVDALSGFALFPLISDQQEMPVNSPLL
jgi:hypothetical protein